jgi:sulfatase maturation enzyme AslB (radical SAM superfamily)
MNDLKQQIKDNEHFCILPFTHTYVSTTGDVNLCCVADWRTPVDNIIDNNITDIWTDSEYQSVRTQMIEGLPVTRCQECYNLDKQGGGSDRSIHNYRFLNDNNHYNKPTTVDIQYGNDTQHPNWIDIRPGRMCNFKCRMCFSAISSAISDELKENPLLSEIVNDSAFDVIEWIDDDVAFESLKQLVPYLDLIKFAGGEPLFMQGVIKFMYWCVNSGNTHLELDITTNGSRTKGKVSQLLSEFNRVFIQFSICGVGPTNDYIRHGAQWQDLDNAYQHYKEAVNIDVNILSTVQLYNAYDIVNIIKYWLDNESNGNLVFNIVHHPEDLDIKLLPHKERMNIADEIESIAQTIPDIKKEQGRLDHVVEYLRDDNPLENVEALRKQWCNRTRELDNVRNVSITDLDKRLAELYNEWR